MTAKEIALRLTYQHFDRRKQLVIPNLTTFVIGEADLVGIYPSGWMDEIEIKISKADFRREFVTKVEKHDRLVRGLPEYRSTRSWEANEIAFDAENPLHEPVMCYSGREQIGFHDWSTPTPHVIRRFWFAMPEDLAQELLPGIPEHAGLISLSERGYPRKLKEAPKLKHARKLTDAERMKILELAYYRYWDIRRGLSEEQATKLEAIQG